MTHLPEDSPNRSSRHPGGRPSRYTPDIGERIADAMATGLSLEAAAASCGIGPRTAFTWQNHHEEFRQALSARDLRLAVGIPRSTAHAQGGGVAGGRTSLEWRTQVLSFEPTCRHSGQCPRRRYQGAGFASKPISNSRKNSAWTTSRDDPGTGSTATPDGDDDLCLPAKPPDRSGGTRKEFSASRPNPSCQ